MTDISVNDLAAV